MATNGKVLVVDNSPIILEVMRATLEEAGYEVVTSGSAEDIVDFVRHSRPDLVLLDMQMPGTTGETAARELKGDAECTDIPVLLVSELPARRLEAAAERSGADGFLEKPSDPDLLVAAVREWVRR